MRDVFDFIDQQAPSFLAELRDFVRQPSISTENTAIQETVAWLVHKMKHNGVDDVRVFETQRHPVILGKTPTTAKPTLLVYGHYDVQPPGERTTWDADPFAAEVVGDRIIGRGTCDMKNNLMATLHAVTALLHCRTSLPINLMFLFEGEEEIGSPSFKPFVEQHKDELSQCDAILCAEGGENKAGQPLLMCGYKGMLYLELSVRSPSATEIHSAYAGVTTNPAWRLVSALASLKENDRVLIPHFYDGVQEPGLGERVKYGLARFAVSRDSLEQAFDAKIRKDMSVSEVLLELFYKPTLNIDGLHSGFTVRGAAKTIIPDSAFAKIDIRLVPGQDSRAILDNLRRYLDGGGFSDVVVETLQGLPPYRIDTSEKIVELVRQSLARVVSTKIMTLPIASGSGAMVWLPLILQKPMASGGCGAAYMAHRPNEFVTIEQYVKGVKLFATIFEGFAAYS